MSSLLLETGDVLLLETGDVLLLDGVAGASNLGAVDLAATADLVATLTTQIKLTAALSATATLAALLFDQPLVASLTADAGLTPPTLNTAITMVASITASADLTPPTLRTAITMVATFTATMTLTTLPPWRVGATFSIITNFSAAEDVLLFTDQSGIIGTYNSTTGVLTLTGQASVAEYDTAIESVRFSIPADTGVWRVVSLLTRAVRIAVGDNCYDPARNVGVSAVKPVVTMTGAALVYREEDDTVLLDGGLTVSDASHTHLAGARVTISTNYVSGKDTLACATQNGIVGVFDVPTGVLTLSGSALIADYQTALRSITFRSVLPPLNVTIAGTTLLYNEDDSSVLLDGALNVRPITTFRAVSVIVNDGFSDSNTVTRNISVTPRAVVAGARVTISTNYVSGEDILACATQNGISGVFDAATGVLTLSGSASIADYMTALRSITFESVLPPLNVTIAGTTLLYTEDDSSVPLDGALNVRPITTFRTASLYVNDGFSNSNTGTRNISVIPRVVIGGVVAFTSNYVSGEDILACATQNGISGVFDAATGVLTLSGSASVGTYQSVLRSVTYHNTTNCLTETTREVSVTIFSAVFTPNTVSRAVRVEALPLSMACSVLMMSPPQNWAYHAGVTVVNGTPQSGFPVSNLVDDTCGTVFKVAETAVTLDVDLGAVHNPVLVALLNTTVDAAVTVRLYGSLTAGGLSSAPLISEIVVDQPSFWLDLRDAALECRYLRVSLTGNGSPLAIGELVVGTVYQFVGVISEGHEITLRGFHERNFTEWGVCSKVTSGASARQMRLGLRLTIAQRRNFNTLFDDAALVDGRKVYVIPNTGGPDVWAVEWAAVHEVTITDNRTVDLSLDLGEESMGVN